MSSELEALWREFAAETDDYLEGLERLLTAGRGAAWNSEAIGALFRAFHSLKGSFALMGMSNVEAVAHRSEDILALVREGRTRLDDDLVDLLLQAVDRLKDMRDVVVSTRADAPAAGKLIARLEQYSGKIAPPRPAEPPPEPAKPASLGADPEMLGIFSELLQERLPDVARVLSEDPEHRGVGAQAAADLANGALVLGFDALAEELEQIGALAQRDDSRAELVARLDALRGQAAVIEELTGAPSGAQPLAMALAVELGPDYQAALATLSAALAAEDEAQVLAAAVAARALANCLNDEHAVQMLLLLEEQQSRISAGELTDSPQLRAVTDEIVDALYQADANEASLDSATAARLARRWQSAIGAAPMSAAELAPSGFALKPEFRATLSAEQITRVEQAVANGKRAFEILVDLESDPDIGGNILSWLTSAVETITSRTVLRDGRSAFEFLVLSGETIDWVTAQLGALDPERLCVQDVREVGREGAATPEAKAQPAAASAFVRVRSDVIDGLMAEVGEMRTVLAAAFEVLRNGEGGKAIQALRPLMDQLGTEAATRVRAGLDAADADLRALASLQGKLETAHRRIWEAGLKLRVVPINALFTRLTRAARDLAQRLAKQVDIAVEGADVRIDKSIVDLLVDPLMHMMRNALDHGIEPADQRLAAGKPARARLSLTAVERGNKVHVTIADDGRGLDKPRILSKAIELGLIAPEDAPRLPDAEIYRLILRPGFSTAEAVTELSGRGVGMDVVASTLQKLGGAIDVTTTPGHGTRFLLTIPLSAALVRSLLVEVENQVLAIAERQIVAVAEIERREIESVSGNRFYSFRDAMIPVHALARLLGFAEAERSEGDCVQLVIVSTGTAFMALLVDQILRFQDLFLKELHPMLAAIPAIGGASVLGDGRPVLVLDAQGLASFSRARDDVALLTAADPT